MGLPLPEDTLADVLRCLPPRSLAASRCVCKAWRDIVDGRGLLLPDLLPHSVHGISLMYHDLDFPAFLARPSAQPEILDKLDLYRPHPNPDLYRFTTILDHRNGLLLYQDQRGMHVANPITQQRAQLPPAPRFGPDPWNVGNLLFDPTESSHYEVLLVPNDRWTEEMDKEIRQQPMDKSEDWPTSIWVLCVFSSRTWQWEERSFVREGDETTKMVLNKISDPLWRASSAYWRGAFFVQCSDGYAILRISLSNDKYRVIDVPAGIRVITEYNRPYLGQSREGVCCASFDDWSKLRIWILDESCGKIEWVLKHHTDIGHNISRVMHCCKDMEGPWTLQDANSAIYYGEDVNNNVEDYGEDVNSNEDDSNNSEDCGKDVSSDEDDDNALVKCKFEWDSDNDNIMDKEYEVDQPYRGLISFLGFHPYKDVVFLNVSLERAVAYHLNTCTIQDLGEICPKYYYGSCACVVSSFVYTPCLIAEFPENKLETHV